MTTKELEKLTPEQKRIKIAEACGWRQVRPRMSEKIHGSDEAGLSGIPPLDTMVLDEFRRRHSLPDYLNDLNDLNAMHEAEATLDDDRAIAYKEMLYATCKQNPRVSLWHVVHATAAQRADAFLLTVG